MEEHVAVLLTACMALHHHQVNTHEEEAKERDKQNMMLLF
jgi:hypothetical protein